MRNAIALGTFDGLHKGHLAVLNMPDGYNKIALTFEKPPKAVITGSTECIMPFEIKAERMLSQGITPEKLKFEEVCNVTAEDFLNNIKIKYNPALISCGFNYRFGKGGLGDTALLKEFCNKNGIILQVCDPVTAFGDTVSSSRIRNYLKNGETNKANALLSEPFFFKGVVTHGDGRGKTLGFPTINIPFPKNLVVPKFGVYKTEIFADGTVFKGITDIGTRPTYPVDFIGSETFIKDFSGNLYGKTVKIALIEFLREEKKFRSAEELKNQVLKDINKI